MKRIKGWIGVLLIFLFGVICGCALSTGATRDKLRALVEGGPDKVVDAIVVRLRRDLQLDGDQQQMLQQIVLETRIKLAGIRQQTEPEVDRVMLDAEGKVRGILHSEQVQKFDAIVKRDHARWKGSATPAPTTPAPQ